MIVLLTMLIGAILGAAIGRGVDAAMGGAFMGLIAGLAIRALRRNRPGAAAQSPRSTTTDPSHAELVETLRAMEQRITALEAVVQRLVVDDSTTTTQRMPGMRQSSTSTDVSTERTERSVAPLTEGASATSDEPIATGPQVADESILAALSGEENDQRATQRESVPPRMPAYGVRRSPREKPSPSEPGALWRFIAGGNTLARVGVIVLFVGVAFLLKYASEHITIPISARLAGVALGGIALLLIGWRLRTRRPGYAVTLQGAGIGVLYLTVFAALRLYDLLPPLAAFVLLFGVAALASYLAVRQDAMALAILGVIGGFAAPILTSRDAGNHVVLFSYYAVLNAGIFAIAWFKAWRLLNIVGFVCTFAIATIWGVSRYRPEDFRTTEPFLVLFFLFYVAIGTLYAIRRATSYGRYVDATLVFATPLIAAGLQSALVRDIRYGMAWSALAGAVVYGALASVLHARRRNELRLLIDCYVALAVVFATLAVPLAFDAQVTSATWALEGAAVVWAGTRQNHVALRVFGLLLQIAAGIAFGLDLSLWTYRFGDPALPILNSHFIGEVLIVVAALISARTLTRGSDVLTPYERAIIPVVFAWGVLWWLAAGSREIEWFLLDARLPAFVAFVTASAVAFAWMAERLAWPLARVPAFLSWPLLLVTALFGIVERPGQHLFEGRGSVAWLAALAVCVLLLRHFERRKPAVEEWTLDAAHAILAWLVALIGAHELAWLARAESLGSAWRIVPWGFVPMLVLAAIVRSSRAAVWPMGTRRRGWLLWGATPLVVGLLCWSLYANVKGTGDAAPLPFVPLLNPLDLTQALAFVAVARWILRVRDVDRESVEMPAPEALRSAAGALLLFWVTFATLRALHQWADVPWTASAMWHARVVQTSLSLVWTSVALASMLIANRVKYRAAWLGGATLLAVVVAKLFVVDLSQVGGVERIVSFIGVGVLLLVVGYVAPVPPRREPA